MLRGNRSILNKVKLTKAVLGSRLFSEFERMNVANEITAIAMGAHDQVKPENVLSKEDLINKIYIFIYRRHIKKIYKFEILYLNQVSQFFFSHFFDDHLKGPLPAIEFYHANSI